MKIRLGWIVLSSIVPLALTIGYIYGIMQPTNDKNWEYGHDILPKITITDTTVTIDDFRDAIHNVRKQGYYSYSQRVVKLNSLTRVWFLLQPFGKFAGIAHSYFVFDIPNEEPIAVSVEARRTKGQKFNSTKGLLNQFTLIYVWSTERDQLGRRVLVDDNTLYMYPLTLTPAQTQKLFLQVAQTTHELEKHPRFYNTFTSNCTNELAKNANRTKPGSIPFDISLFLPGYSDKLLYRLNYITNDVPYAQVRQKYLISNYVKNHYAEATFSAMLREAIL